MFLNYDCVLNILPETNARFNVKHLIITLDPQETYIYVVILVVVPVNEKWERHQKSYGQGRWYIHGSSWRQMLNGCDCGFWNRGYVYGYGYGWYISLSIY